MFIDKARIFVTAGRGGAGCISFRREKYVPMGGPDGGNGGKGGDIYIEADPHLNTLLDLTYRPYLKAKDGQPGGSANKYGRGAEDLVIRVPPGTVIYKNLELFADLKEPHQKVIVAKGGRGGRGNHSFKTHKHTAPRVAEKGEPGEIVTVNLELMLIADVGLCGLPNAGKSTLLSRISAARPKIADYPFTTLSPNLGIAKFAGKSFAVADIPGLIEGAHKGKGLGDDFLRHIRRTRVLVHLVDVFGFGDKTAYENYRTIKKELSSYSKKLAQKPSILAANKMDLTGSAEKLKEFKKRLKGVKVWPISCATGEGIDAVMKEAVKVLNTPVKKDEAVVETVKTYTYEPDFRIEKIGEVFFVKGAKVEKLSDMTVFKEEEALRRFQNIFKKMGVDKALKENNIQPGDVVRVGKFEFIYKE